MNRFVRIWLVLSIAYASGMLVVDIGAYGMLATSASRWLAIPVIAALQTLVLVAIARLRARSGEAS